MRSGLGEILSEPAHGPGDGETGPHAVPLSPTPGRAVTAMPRQPGNPCLVFGRSAGGRPANPNGS